MRYAWIQHKYGKMENKKQKVNWRHTSSNLYYDVIRQANKNNIENWFLLWIFDLRAFRLLLFMNGALLFEKNIRFLLLLVYIKQMPVKTHFFEIEHPHVASTPNENVKTEETVTWLWNIFHSAFCDGP